MRAYSSYLAGFRVSKSKIDHVGQCGLINEHGPHIMQVYYRFLLMKRKQNGGGGDQNPDAIWFN
jgi:hypothetical protein